MFETALLVGATGLVGRAVIAGTERHPQVRLSALARREVPLPKGARVEVLVADPAEWAKAIAQARPAVLIIALGTTIHAVGGSRDAFRAVDHDLVITLAQAAKEAGARQVILVSSVGACATSRNFYLSVKGEVEQALDAMRFQRLDILRPGLLRGRRDGPLRLAERLGQGIAPFIDLFLHGKLARYRSTSARDVAEAMLALVGASGRGCHVHDSGNIHRLAC